MLRVISPFFALAACLVCAALLDRALLRRADWGLLCTFVAFFIFVGNLQALPGVRDFLGGLVGGHELLSGVLCSQVISNVPAAVLLSGFSEGLPALLRGVNIGGLGTLIASMASLISYKRYAALECARKGRYMAVFTLVNLAFLFCLLAFSAFFLP